uniref:Uncharacterized protein n=1 Tax=Timema shepardi TaxID=629360 RepID=A0A7R9G7D0_TIMSH|nr:unnamed protein product [Timema shepardi]
MLVNPRWRLLHLIGHQTVRGRFELSSTHSILSKPFTKRFALARCRPSGARGTVGVNRSTSGIGCSPMTLTTTVKEYSWTGSCSLHAVFAAANLPLATRRQSAPTCSN